MSGCLVEDGCLVDFLMVEETIQQALVRARGASVACVQLSTQLWVCSQLEAVSPQPFEVRLQCYAYNLNFLNFPTF